MLVVITSVIVGAEFLYIQWGVKLNYKAISHLLNPLEVLNTATYKII